MIGQDYVTGRIKLDQDVIGCLTSTKCDVDDSIDTQLGNILYLFSS